MTPFSIAVPDSDLQELRERLARTRFSDATGFAPWEDGTPPDYVCDLVAYWREGFDWRSQEAALNAFSHLRGEIDGTAIHCIHEHGKGPAPLPLLLVHGYPDSVWRFYKLIPLLADPAAHGGDPADAFDLVVPSLPRTAHGAPSALAMSTPS